MSQADSIFVWHIFHILPSEPSKTKCKICIVELYRGEKTSKTLNTINLPKHILCKHGEEYKIEQSLMVTEKGDLSNRNYTHLLRWGRELLRRNMKSIQCKQSLLLLLVEEWMLLLNKLFSKLSLWRNHGIEILLSHLAVWWNHLVQQITWK